MEKIITELLDAGYPDITTAVKNWLVDKLKREAKTEEEAKKLVEELSMQKIIEGYADMRATQASKTAVENYEKKHNLKDGARQEENDKGEGSNNPPTGVEDSDTPEWAKQLIKQQTALREEINSIKAGKIRESRTEVITELVKNLPEGLRKGYLLANFEKLSDEEFESVKDEIKDVVAEHEKTVQSKGARLQEPPRFGGKNDKNELPSEEDGDNFLQQMGMKKIRD